jgi:type II secretory pathway pseudopilin PulG
MATVLIAIGVIGLLFSLTAPKYSGDIKGGRYEDDEPTDHW